MEQHYNPLNPEEKKKYYDELKLKLRKDKARREREKRKAMEHAEQAGLGDFSDSEITDLRAIANELREAKEHAYTGRDGRDGHDGQAGQAGQAGRQGDDGKDGFTITKVHVSLAIVAQVASWVVGWIISVSTLQSEVKSMKQDIMSQQSANSIIMDKLTRMETDIKWIVRERRDTPEGGKQ